MRRARESAAKAQREYDVEGERVERERMQRGRSPLNLNWRFEELLNSRGELAGWRVDYNGKIAGMIMIKGRDLAVIASDPEEDYDSPQTTDIMAAWSKGPGRER
jgi:hypothetical protein